MSFASRPDCVDSTVHEIGTGTSMHMNINVSGCYESTVGINDLHSLWQSAPAVRSDDPASFAPDHAICNQPVRQNDRAVDNGKLFLNDASHIRLSC